MDFKERLKEETQDLATKVNKLNDFMRTKDFYKLERNAKDLLYEQQEHMTKYLQILGKRLELMKIKLELESWE